MTQPVEKTPDTYLQFSAPVRPHSPELQALLSYIAQAHQNTIAIASCPTTLLT
jgi:hypothetical protein